MKNDENSNNIVIIIIGRGKTIRARTTAGKRFDVVTRRINIPNLLYTYIIIIAYGIIVDYSFLRKTTAAIIYDALFSVIVFLIIVFRPSHLGSVMNL